MTTIGILDLPAPRAAPTFSQNFQFGRAAFVAVHRRQDTPGGLP